MTKPVISRAAGVVRDKLIAALVAALLFSLGCPGSRPPAGPSLDSGVPRWVRPVTATGPVAIHAIAVTGDGGVIVGGEFSGTLAIGPRRAASAGGRDGFVARLDGRGEPAWVRRIGGPGDDRITAVAVSGSGAIGIGGQVATDIELGEIRIAARGAPDAFAGELGPGGDPRWLAGLGATRHGQVGGVGFTSGGDLVVAGSFAGSLELTGRSIFSAGAQDLFVVRLRSSGQPLWAVRGGGAGADLGAGLAIGEDDQIYVAGSVMDEASLGGAAFETVGEDPDALVAELDSGGALRWARALGGAGHDTAAAVATDGGGIALVGRFARELVAGEQTTTAAGGADGFLARLSSGGEPGPVTAVGGDGEDALTALASGDGLVAAGTFTGSIGEVRSAGGLDIVAMKLVDDELRWRRRLGGSGDDIATAVALAPDGAVALAGSSTADLDIGKTHVATDGHPVAFVTLLDP
jgi:hypothetical protein